MPELRSCQHALSDDERMPQVGSARKNGTDDADGGGGGKGRKRARQLDFEGPDSISIAAQVCARCCVLDLGLGVRRLKSQTASSLCKV